MKERYINGFTKPWATFNLGFDPKENGEQITEQTGYLDIEKWARQTMVTGALLEAARQAGEYDFYEDLKEEDFEALDRLGEDPDMDEFEKIDHYKDLMKRMNEAIQEQRKQQEEARPKGPEKTPEKAPEKAPAAPAEEKKAA